MQISTLGHEQHRSSFSSSFHFRALGDSQESKYVNTRYSRKESACLRKKFSMLRVAVPGQSTRDFHPTIVDEDGINERGETIGREKTAEMALGLTREISE